ncbi:YtxH domain-containing protein [Terrilactibacillus sp. S3-3]|nr:YtxH domain-containing protein [Terrilactibacillus sp. S3-3]
MSSKNDEKNCGFAATQLVIGSIIGGAVGATAALLLAPKTGEEFRKDLKNAAC